MRVALLPVVVLSALSLRVSIVYTEFTPFRLPETLESALRQSAFPKEVSLLQVSSAEEVDAIDTELVLDYSYSEAVAARIRTHAEMSLRMWRTEATTGLHYQTVFSQYVEAMNFTNILVLTNSDEHSLALATAIFRSKSHLYRDVSVVPKGAEKNVLLKIVGKQIKPRGINLVAVFLSAEETRSFLEAAEEVKLNRAGYAFILSEEAGLYRFFPHCLEGLQASGALIISDSAGTAATREEFEATVLAQQLRLLTGNESVIGKSAEARSRQPQIALLSMNNSQTSIAALSPTEVSARTRIQFPGNTTAFPKLQKAKIRASVNYRLINPDLSRYPLSGPVMRGFEVAFREANSRTDLIPDYYLEDAPVEFTGIDFSYNQSLARVSASRSDLGLIFMSPPVTQCIIGMSRVFTDLNLTVPITSGSAATELSDPRAFPLFVRSRVSNGYSILVTARMIRYFGWSRLAVLYAGDKGDYEDGYLQLLKIVDKLGISILNSENSRRLPVILNNQTAEIVNASLSEIKTLDTRIILIMHNYNFVIMEQMYDLGMFGYLQIQRGTLNDASFANPTYIKRRKVSKGALMFFPRLFIGAVGERVYKALAQRDGKGIFSNTCFYYDAAYLYFYATQYLLERGLDYEDPYLIVKAMRESYFHGCSGFIKIESGTNDRAASEIAITNFQYNSENDTYELKVVGGYNPFSTQPYQFTSKIQWPAEGDYFSDTKPRYKDCPFLEEIVRDMNEGRIIGLAVDFSVAIVTVVVTILMWRRWWNVSPPLLNSKRLISTEDVLVVLTVCFDYFQFAAVGPDLSHVSDFLASIAASLGLDIEELITVTHGVYWIVLDVVLGVTGVWIAFCVMKLARVDAVTGYWSNLLLPTLGNWLFLPIVSTLTNAFLCYQGISKQLADSFLNKDCYEFCWRKGHLGYVVGSGIALLAYLPMAIFTRPIWQELQDNVHVKSQPAALLVKSAVQVFLIVASNTLKRDSPNIHAYIFFTTVSIYILFMLTSRQYNYDRLNLWQVLIMVAMLSLSVAGYWSQQYSPQSAVKFILALAVEYSVLCGVGIVVQKLVKRFESKLVREKRRDLRGLFIFAFTAGQRAQEGLQQFYSENLSVVQSVVTWRET